MLEIILEHNCKEELTGFTVEGHAGKEPRGENIVCAAVSILTKTTAASLGEIVQLQPEEFHMQEGRMVCRTGEITDPEKKKQVQLLLRSMELGLKETSRHYPGYLEISYSERLT